MSDWTLHLGDCIAGLATLGDKSVDHVICDPPYDAKTDAGHVKAGGRSRVKSIGVGVLDAESESLIARELERITKRWILVFCADEQLGSWQAAFRSCGRIVRDGWWRKTNGSPQFTGDRPGVPGEHIAIAHGGRSGRMKWNGGGRHAYWETNTCSGRERTEHPTQKPLDLMRMLVEDFTDPGDLVLDPFAGSGTTGVACRMLGRRFIGWELSPAYHEIACRRLRGEEAVPNAAQPSLFGVG